MREAEPNGLDEPPVLPFRAAPVRGYQQTQRLEQECTLINPLLMRAYLRLRHNEEGQTLVEYALILVLVSTAAFTLLSAVGGFPTSVFSKVNADF